MLGIKKSIIKSMFKYEVVGNKPGDLQISVPKLKKVEEEDKKYAIYGERALKYLDGVQDVKIDYAKGLVDVIYDITKTTGRKIYKWIEIVVDLTIDNYEDYKDIWSKENLTDEDIEKLWKIAEVFLAKNIGRV